MRLSILFVALVLSGCANVLTRTAPPQTLDDRTTPPYPQSKLGKMARVTQEKRANAQAELEAIEQDHQKSVSKPTSKTRTILSIPRNKTISTPDLSDPNSNTLSGVYPITDGVEAFATRSALVKNAQYRLDLQYYSLKKGLSSRLLIRELVAAADRGVLIRILLDDTEVLGRDEEMSILDGHPNIEVRVFNPVKRWRTSKVTRSLMFVYHLKSLHRRMHNKLWIADGSMAIAGGRNVGDRYFNASEENNFTDFDVLVTGHAITPINESFERFWRSSNAYTVSLFDNRSTNYSQKELHDIIVDTNNLTQTEKVIRHPYLVTLHDAESQLLTRILPKMYWGKVDFFVDDDQKINREPLINAIQLPKNNTENPDTPVFNAIAKMVATTQHELIIVNPYFIPGDEFAHMLIDLAQSGKRVVVITNSVESNDIPLSNAPYDRYRKMLLKGGIELYELRGHPDVETTPQWRRPIFSWNGSRSELHTKVAIVDGKTSFMGSMNLDPQSIIWNTEIGLSIAQEKFSSDMHDLLLGVTNPRYSYRVVLNNGTLEWHSANRQIDPQTKRTILVPQIQTQEPGNFLRHIQKGVGKLIPEKYL